MTRDPGKKKLGNDFLRIHHRITPHQSPPKKRADQYVRFECQFRLNNPFIAFFPLTYVKLQAFARAILFLEC